MLEFYNLKIIKKKKKKRVRERDHVGPKQEKT